MIIDHSEIRIGSILMFSGKLIEVKEIHKDEIVYGYKIGQSALHETNEQPLTAKFTQIIGAFLNEDILHKLGFMQSDIVWRRGDISINTKGLKSADLIDHFSITISMSYLDHPAILQWPITYIHELHEYYCTLSGMISDTKLNFSQLSEA